MTTASTTDAPDRYTLYGARGAGSAAVEAALEIAAFPFTVIEAAPWEPGPGLDALKAVNPLAQIPTLVTPEGALLTESAAILIHLGLVHPASKLLPASPDVRARSLRGLVFIPANCYSMITVIDYPERLWPGADEATRKTLIAGARARLHANWNAFADAFAPESDQASADTAWLGDPSGARPGALDLLAAVVSKWSGARAHLAAHRPKLSRLLERVDAHPGVAPVFKRHFNAA